MSTDGRSAADWVGSFRTSAAAWWLPQLVIVAALLLPPAARGVIWVIALAWMGTACLLNSRRCGRMHCRFTGPYYLAMILPTLLLGAGMIPLDSMDGLSWGAPSSSGVKLCGGRQNAHGENTPQALEHDAVAWCARRPLCRLGAVALRLCLWPALLSQNQHILGVFAFARILYFCTARRLLWVETRQTAPAWPRRDRRIPARLALPPARWLGERPELTRLRLKSRNNSLALRIWRVHGQRKCANPAGSCIEDSRLETVRLIAVCVPGPHNPAVSRKAPRSPRRLQVLGEAGSFACRILVAANKSLAYRRFPRILSVMEIRNFSSGERREETARGAVRGA
jgi:hypothetical protein